MSIIESNIVLSDEEEDLAPVQAIPGALADDDAKLEPIQSLRFAPKGVSLSDLENTEYEGSQNLQVSQPTTFTSQNVKKSSESPDSSGSIDQDYREIPLGTTTTAVTDLEPDSQTEGWLSTANNEEYQESGPGEDFEALLASAYNGEFGGEQDDGPLPEYLESAFPEEVSLRISQMDIQTEEKAREIANYILSVLEQDVVDYFERRGLPLPTTPPPPPPPAKTKAYKGSNISLKEEWSDMIPNQPSTMRLFYEKGLSEFRERSIANLPEELKVDAVCEANLHRNKRRFRRGPPLKFMNIATQTREMTLVTEEIAERTFRRMYPRKEDWKPPPIPSRKASMDIVIDFAEGEDPNVDKARVGPKVKWSSKKRLLPPLPEDYYKVETFWTGSTFRGEYIKRQFQHGFYNYPLMATYESEFKEGHIHSRKHLGIVSYPRGDTFEGQWRKGRHISGKITFCDDLEFLPRNWEYCAAADRRFFIERDVGMRQAGRTLYNNRLPPPIIPPGCFDTGDGIYNPKDGVVTGYNDQKLRDATYFEHNWVLENCRKVKEVDERYVASFNVDRLPCSFADHYLRQ